MTEKLKPCPFCGGSALLSTPNNGKQYRVGCYDANGLAEEDYDRGDNCKLYPCTGLYVNRNEAIKQWNTRADMHTELVEALEAANKKILQLQEIINDFERGMDTVDSFSYMFKATKEGKT